MLSWCESLEKAERRVKIHRRSLDHGLTTWLHEWNNWLWKTATYRATDSRQVGSLHTILHGDLKSVEIFRQMGSVNADRWKQGFSYRNVSGNVITRQRYKLCFVLLITMDETRISLFNFEIKRQSAQLKHSDSPPLNNCRVTASAVLRKW